MHTALNWLGGLVLGTAITTLVGKYFNDQPFLLYEIGQPTTHTLPIGDPATLEAMGEGIPITYQEISFRNDGSAPATDFTAKIVFSDIPNLDGKFVNPLMTWRTKVASPSIQSAPDTTGTTSAPPLSYPAKVRAIVGTTTTLYPSGKLADSGPIVGTAEELSKQENGIAWLTGAGDSAAPILIKRKRFLQGDVGAIGITWTNHPPTKIKSIVVESDQGPGFNSSNATWTFSVGVSVLRENLAVLIVSMLMLIYWILWRKGSPKKRHRRRKPISPGTDQSK